MKAMIRMDRETGWWHWDVRAPGMRMTGERERWEDALAGALSDMAWVSEREQAWPESLIPLGWRSLRKLIGGYACESAFTWRNLFLVTATRPWP